jgi:hypothetical protein
VSFCLDLYAFRADCLASLSSSSSKPSTLLL